MSLLPSYNNWRPTPPPVACETPATVRFPVRNVLRNVDGELAAFDGSSWNDRLGRFKSAADIIGADRDLPITNRAFAGTLYTGARRWRDVLVPNAHETVLDSEVATPRTRRRAPRQRDA